MRVLPTKLITEFVKTTNDAKPSDTKPSTYRGTTVVNDSGIFVQLDGSSVLTPVSMATDAKNGDRVLVVIENHKAVITSNFTSPASGRTATDLYYVTKDADGNVVVEGELRTAKQYVDELIGKNITAESIDVGLAEVDTIKGDQAIFKETVTEKFEAAEGRIDSLETTKLDAESADLKYANIDFSNIGKAAMEYFYAQSGLIENVIVGDQKITGTLVGVTILGELIKGGTVIADKLVIRGEDGLFYKLNTDGETVEKEQTEYNALDGKHLMAKTVTANKIAVDDLVAFDATLGGFIITKNSIYSGVKASVDNTTRGFYVDNDGQMAVGDGNQYIRYYRVAEDEYKLEISAKSVTMGTGGGKPIDEVIEEVKKDVDSLRDEITTLLRIESSRGTVFKNDQVSTVLSAVIYHGTQRITDMPTLKMVFGQGAYLEWKWQRLDEDSYGIISSSDSRFGNEGFTFTLSPEDVDTKVTFMCELIV